MRGKHGSLGRRPLSRIRDMHSLLESLDFLGLNCYPSLAPGTALVVPNREQFATNEQTAVVRLPEPIIQRRYSDAQTARGFLHGEQVEGHVK